MIATVNGITVCGTPEEILRFQELVESKQKEEKSFFKPLQPGQQLYPIYPFTTYFGDSPIDYVKTTCISRVDIHA